MSKNNFWERQTDKIGALGSVITALCCLGFPALLSILSAIGLGFLINDAVLIPLLIGFLLATLVGLYFGIRHHGSWLAIIVGTASAVSTVIFIVVIFNRVAAIISVTGLVAASLLNVWLRVRKAES